MLYQAQSAASISTIQTWMLAMVIFLLSKALFSSSEQTAGAETLQSSEYSALQDLYYGTGGDTWHWHNKSFGAHWNFTDGSDPCIDNWQGLTCTNVPEADGFLHVLEINLTFYKMTGSIPSSIGNLTWLTTLDMAHNYISGTVPRTLRNLPNLRTIDVSSNYISGTLDALLCNLPRLQSVSARYNKFTGSIPLCTVEAADLRKLSLAFNALNGTFPAVIFNLTNLEVVQLRNNLVSGTLPDKFEMLPQLRVLDLDRNAITGTLPDSLSTLSTLQEFDCSFNYNLHGTIPAYFGSLSTLKSFRIAANQFSGTVPASFTNLQQLQVIDLFWNQLHGPLPTLFCNLPSLLYADLANNTFTGTISSCYGGLTNMIRLFLDYNYLSGTLPQSLCNLTLMLEFYVRVNMLTGTLPECMGNWTNFRVLRVEDNQFSGTLPASYCLWHHLRYLDVSTQLNFLTGTVPACIGNWTRLETLSLYSNDFSGTVPTALAMLPILQEIDIGSNSFEGAVPILSGAAGTLAYLYMDNNLLTLLPNAISVMHSLIQVLLYNNLLSGTVPETISTLARLSILSLEYNMLTGSLDGVFNASVQRNLTTVLLYNNRLRGALPEELFKLPILHVMVAAENCLETALPLALCNASYLATLSLDGMHSAPACRSKILPGISGAYFSPGRDDNALLECLFQLPRLQTLHLSGNSITGTLPDVDVLPTHLLDLVLSHNKLIGTIPLQYQQKSWLLLDLSYNRLSGTMSKSFASYDPTYSVHDAVFNTSRFGHTLSLFNNRLSGKIPGSVQNMVNVSVLGSNLYSCNLDRTELPPHDSDSNTYICGSTAFDVPFYTWLVLSGITVAALCVAWWQLRTHPAVASAIDLYRKWLTVAAGQTGNGSGDQRLVYTTFLNCVCLELHRTTVLCFGFILLVMLPTLAALSAFYSTMTYQYTYKFSAAFISSAAACAAVFALVMLLIGIYVVRVWQTETAATNMLSSFGAGLALRNSSQSKRVGAASTSTNILLRFFAACVLFAVLNLALVVGVNVAYVYIVVYKSASAQQLAQVPIAVFKIVWNRYGVGYLRKWVRWLMLGDEGLPRQLENRFIMLQILNAWLNNIIIPCLVVAIVSPSCFYNVFVPAPPVDTQFFYELCADFEFANGQCRTYQVFNATSSYAPSFTYSYQCSSSIITSYAPVFIVLSIIAGFVVPAAEMIAVFAYTSLSSTSIVHCVLDKIMPAVLKPIYSSAYTLTDVNAYVQVRSAIVVMMSYMGVMLTFGAVFPLVAVALAATVLWLITYYQLKLGRFLAAALDNKRQNAVDAVEKEVRRAGLVSVLWRSSWLLVTVSCLFYALFLFDTLGDAVGFDEAYWVLIVMPLMPIVFYGVYAGIWWWFVKSEILVSVDQGTMLMELPAGTRPSAATAADATISALHGHPPPSQSLSAAPVDADEDV